MAVAVRKCGDDHGAPPHLVVPLVLGRLQLLLGLRQPPLRRRHLRRSHSPQHVRRRGARRPRAPRPPPERVARADDRPKTDAKEAPGRRPLDTGSVGPLSPAAAARCCSSGAAPLTARSWPPSPTEERRDEATRLGRRRGGRTGGGGRAWGATRAGRGAGAGPARAEGGQRGGRAEGGAGRGRTSRPRRWRRRRPRCPCGSSEPRRPLHPPAEAGQAASGPAHGSVRGRASWLGAAQMTGRLRGSP